MGKHDLQRFSDAFLALQECRSLSDLGPALIKGLSSLCDADTYTINSVGPEKFGVYSTSVEYSTGELEVFNAHLKEHPLYWVVERARTGECAIGRWSDSITLREFRQKALYHDFFRLVGVRRQIGAVVRVDDRITLGLALNRRMSDFCSEDVLRVQMLLPHVRSVGRRLLGQLAIEEAFAARELAAADEAVVVVNENADVLFATERARRWITDYHPLEAERPLPLAIVEWLRGRPAAGERFVRRRGEDCLTCICGHPAPRSDAATRAMGDADHGPVFLQRLQFTEHRRAAALSRLEEAGLTSRETEVLQWIAEGKRNSEIAIILGISERTVAKHCENLFAKLYVETRTAAVAAYSALMRNA